MRSPHLTAAVDLSGLPAETQRVVAEFQQQLTNVAGAAAGPLVVLIDELDRCRPGYAVGTLEAVRHLFTADGVVVVVAVNRQQLVEAVNGLYGAEFDADRYLRRFSDRRVPLRTPDRDTRAPFVVGLADETGLGGQSRTDQWCQSVLDLVTGLPDFELRDAQHAAHLATVALSSGPPPHVSAALWERYVFALVLLRLSDKHAYAEFADGRIGSFAAVRAFYSAIRPIPQDDSLMSTRYEAAAALINIGSVDLLWNPDRFDLFKSAYQRTGEGPPEAEAVWEHLQSSYPVYPPITAGQVVALIDLAVYDPPTT